MNRREFSESGGPASGDPVTGPDNLAKAEEKKADHLIKLVFCARRHPSMSRSEFQQYWLNHHGPLFQKFARPTGQFVTCKATPSIRH